MGSKNVGQVSGMCISTTPPENINMIWWDSTPSQLCHKIYDSKLKQWVILNQGILSTITYNELKNLALSVGLSVGKFYVITDKGNILALSITRTKIQYVDLSGNLLVDDLGSNITYYVSSNNLSIDGENGVFNKENTKLDFNFLETVPNIESAYIFGKDKKSKDSSVMRLIKFKLNSLLSTVTGNALSWKSGLYFNFNETLLSLGDKKGGVVLFDSYSKDKEIQDQSIENIANNYNALVSQVNSLIKEATSDVNILNKKITALETGGEPTDAAAGDSIYKVLSKFQRYINKFKYASGISVDKRFTANEPPANINNNDTVLSALQKTQGFINKFKYATGILLSKDFNPTPISDVSVPNANDTVDSAMRKISTLSTRIQQNQLLDGVINFDKIAKTGVLPTDILRLELSTAFDFTGGGIGGVMIQGYDNSFFIFDSEHPYNPYRLGKYYNSEFPKILSFVPVIPVIPNETNNYANANALVHFVEGDATVQFIFQIPKKKAEELTSSGKKNFKCIVQADVYNYKTAQREMTIPIRVTNDIIINFRKDTLNKGGQQHVVLYASITPV